MDLSMVYIALMFTQQLIRALFLKEQVERGVKAMQKKLFLFLLSVLIATAITLALPGVALAQDENMKARLLPAAVRCRWEFL